ncbi:unnamed protein product [Closterium sp. NIES-54]
MSVRCTRRPHHPMLHAGSGHSSARYRAAQVPFISTIASPPPPPTPPSPPPAALVIPVRLTSRPHHPLHPMLHAGSGHPRAHHRARPGAVRVSLCHAAQVDGYLPLRGVALQARAAGRAQQNHSRELGGEGRGEGGTQHAVLHCIQVSAPDTAPQAHAAGRLRVLTACTEGAHCVH